MLFLVKDLLSDGQRPLTTSPQVPAAQALRLMADHDFSQLPVVDTEGKYLGRAITERAILNAITAFDALPTKLLVDDVAPRAATLRSDADLLAVLDEVQREGFRVVVDAQERVTGILTTADITAHFRRYAEDLMVVQSVESILKKGVQSLFGGDAAGLEASIRRVTDRSKEAQGRLNTAIRAYLSGNGTGAVQKLDPVGLDAAAAILFPSKPVKAFNELTFEEYKELFLSHKDCPKLGYSTDQKELRHLLTRVRDIRNKLAHFRGELDAEERGVIRFAAAWLERRFPNVAGGAIPMVSGKDSAAPPAEEQ